MGAGSVLEHLLALDLYEAYAWIREVAAKPNLERLKFVFLDVDMVDIAVYRKYRHYIDLDDAS